jgi:hypothetical protein
VERVPEAARPGERGSFLDQLLQELVVSWDWQARVEIIGLTGQNTAGGDVTVRFRASRATVYVQVHVQTDAVGEGGATYDPVNFKSSTRVACLESRQQDVVIGRGAGDHYYLWLVPVMLDGNGSTFVKFDGVDSADDFMSYWDLGI